VAAQHLSPDLGVVADSLDVVSTWQALNSLASEVIVLLDHVDISTQGIVGVVPIKSIAHVILDQRAPGRIVDMLRLAGITVSLCGSSVVTVPPLTGRPGAYKIGFANLSETEVFTAQVRRSVEIAAQRAGNIELLLADNNADGETALRNAEQFIAGGADLVIEFQMDESYAYRLMHRFRLAHIPVIAVDIPHPGATFFGIDDYAAGWIASELLAKKIVRRWDGRLDRLIALGLPRAGCAVAARILGQIAALRETINVDDQQIIALDSQNQHDASYKGTLKVVGSIAVDARLGVIGINDPAVRGALEALLETGHGAYTMAVTQGADRLALEDLQRPGTNLVGAVVFSAETYGDRLIPLALDILAGKDVPPAVYQHHRLVRQGEARQILNARRVASAVENLPATGTKGERSVIAGG
jgi:ribose transport system substrate-binding protein